ncbi:PAS domain S-box protein [Spirulina sp. 06S082]|uniref:PAS domain-containing sensor histidine kinase n=1 Tax=Spirulina sp. 06S082 TaxID=3110248 RepID=UPI002B20C56C|nr:PAS domain S-box protein [Spirulina sp. 06S082]MEA5470773.1 PAS domain S-box protein [Spirulina sp. 06S082]
MQDLLQVVIEQSPVALALCDREMRYLLVSQCWLEDYGLKHNIIGQSYYDTFPNLPSHWYNIHQQCLAGAIERGQAEPLQLSDGRTEWVEWEIKPWRTNTGDIGGVILHSRFVSDRLKADISWTDIFQNYPSMICLAGFDGYFQHLNPAWEQNLGWSEKELKSKPFLEFVHPGDREATLKTANDLAEGQKIVSFENRYLCKDGTYKWFSWTCTALLEQDKIYAVARDITDRKHAEAQLQHHQDLLQQVLDTTPNWLFVKDREGVYILANRALAEALDMDTEEIIGKKDEDLFAPTPQIERFQQENLEVLTTLQEKIISEDRAIAIKGKTFWTETIKRPLFLPGNPAPHVLISITDVSQRKKIEQALRQSERRYQVLAETSPVGIFHTDREGNCIYGNQQACILTGLTPQAILGMGWFNAIHPRDRRRVLREWHLMDVEASFTLLEERHLFQSEFRFSRSDGSIRWVYAQACAISDSHDRANITGYVGTCTDITDRKQVENALQTSEQDLRTIFNGVYDAIFIHDLEGNILEVNDRVLSLFGVTQEEASQYAIADYTARETDLERLPEIWHRAREGEELQFEWRVKRPKDEAKLDVEVRLRRIILHDQTVILATVRDITKQKKAEKEMQKLAALVENSSDFIGITTLEGQSVFLNAAGLELVGLESLEAAQKYSLADYLPIEDRGIFEQEILPKLLEIGSWRGEVRFRNFTTQQIIPVDSTLFTIRSSRTGEPVAFASVTRDLSDRVRVSTELTRYKQAVDSASDAIAIADASGSILYINRAFCQLYGCETVSQLRRWGGISSLFNDPSAIQGLFSTVMSGRTWSHEVEQQSLTGETIQVFLRANALLDRHQEIVGLVTIATDISDRKRSEIALIESKQRLQEQVERERLLNSLSNQIRSSLATPEQDIIELALQEIRHFLNIDRVYFVLHSIAEEGEYWDVVAESRSEDVSSIIGRYPVSSIGSLAERIFQMEIIREPDVSLVEEPIFRQLLEELNIKSILNIPMRISADTIAIIGCNQNRSIRSWSDPEVELLVAAIGQLAIAINQSQLFAKATESAAIARAKAEELETTLKELRRTQTQLIQTEKMSSLGQLVAGVAHEINNPVNFIYGNLNHADNYLRDIIGLLNLYQTHYPQPVPEIVEEMEAIDLNFLLEDLPKLFTSMQTGADRIREIVISLRTFSRMDESEKKSVDIHAGIESTLTILQSRLKAKSDRQAIEIIRDYGDLPKIECYAGQLNQVFMNILSNALDALEEGDRADEEVQNQPSTIRIRTQIIDNQKLEVSIADNGSGIPEEIQQRLFDPFFTTKEIGKGTGLGLSISYQIVTEKHGGTLECISTLGQGTEFLITIPFQ